MPLLEIRPIQRTKRRKNGTREKKETERHEEEQIYLKKYFHTHRTLELCSPKE